MKPFQDKSGREVAIGDYIIYAQTWGRSAGMNYGRVIDIKLSNRTSWGPKKYTTLRIIATDPWQTGLLQKPSTINYSDRILVISSKQVHAKALKTLLKYKEKVHGR